MSYIMKVSQFNHPDITSGQHSNGPRNIFVRNDDSSPWYVVIDSKSVARTRKELNEIGFAKFVALRCAKLED